MATITVSASHNYSGDNLGPNPIDAIEFTNAAGAVATFGSGQFGAGAGLIANNVTITGNNQINQVKVNISAAGTFSAANWQFSGWSPAANDIVVLSGAAGAETITGSSQRDTITPGDGADHVNGGGGNDTFAVEPGHLDAGETIDGGDGFDVFGLGIGAALDLTLAGTSIVNVERVQFQANTSLTARGDHFGGGGFTEILSADAGAHALIVNGANVSLGKVTFTNWGAANKTITINGAAGPGNTLIGSSQKDTINGVGNSSDVMTGGLGADTLNGGNGNDTFRYTDGAEAEAGEIVQGGGTTPTKLCSSTPARSISPASPSRASSSSNIPAPGYRPRRSWERRWEAERHSPR